MADNRANVTLTDQQQQIVAHTHGPALVVAVAGAGKTTAMVHRVERLVHAKIFAPQKILVSSFNKAAVDDIGQALAAWPSCRSVARYTLHALGFKLVRHAADHGRLRQLPPDALKTNGDERQILWAARELARRQSLVPAGELDALDEQDLLNYIGACKGNLRYPDLAATRLPAAALKVARQAEAPPALPWYLTLYKLHEEVRRERGWLTFDDMLLLGWETLVRYPDLLEHWQRTYDAVIVDEFQDVNLAQAELLDLLTRAHTNYMAIGDDDQTIYSFRGASMSFFRGFGQRYGGPTYTMTDNFRCQATQVLLANRVIAQNRERHPKALVITQGFGGATVLRRSADVVAMGRQLVEDILTAQAAGHVGAEIAILVRLTAQTPPLEQALIAARIPYRVAGEEPFFRRREVVELLKYPELAAFDAKLRAGRRLSRDEGERFEACWRSVYNRPKRYLSRQVFHETVQLVRRQGCPLSQILVERANQGAGRGADALHELAALLLWLAEARHQLSAEELLRTLDTRLGYQGFLLRNSGVPETGAAYAANVAAFLQYARGKGTLADLQAHLSDLATGRQALEATDRHAIDIRTIHKAKGLEWPVVLIPNCNAGTIPIGDATNLEEERRLLYVAITRARRRLHLYALTGGDAQLSPFLVNAQAEQVLQRTDEIAKLLATDPTTWTAAQTLSLATFPREFSQERFFSQWWQASATVRRRVAERVLAFLQVVTERKGLERVGLTTADRSFWRSLAPEATAVRAAAFPGLDALCPRWTGWLGR